MSDLIERSAALYELETTCSWTMFDAVFGALTPAGEDIRKAIAAVPSVQIDTKSAYEQGRIQGRIEMRTELLMLMKEYVGDEVWKNI